MSPKLLLTTALICAFVISYAQLPKVVWGPEYKAEGGLNYLLGNDGDYFYTIIGDQEKPQFLKFDLNCKVVSTSPLNINPTKDQNEELIIEDIINLKENKYLILLARNKKMDQSNYYYSELKNGKMVLPAKKFYTVPFSFSYGTGLGAGPWCLDGAALTGLKVSPNEKYVASFSTDFKNTGKRSFTVAVFDDKLTKVWQKDFPLDVKCEKIMMNDFVVNNNGEVYTLAQEWEKSENTSPSKYDYLIMKFSQTQMERYDMTLNGGNIGEQTLLTTTETGDPVATGIYIKKEGKSNYLGFFYSYLDNGKMKSTLHPFPANVLALQKSKYSDKENYLRFLYVSNEIVRHSDGGFTYLVERQSHNSETGLLMGSMELIIPRFSATGQLMFVNTLDRIVKGNNNQIHYATVIAKGDAVTLLYNNETAIGTKATGKDLLYTDICQISADGKASIYNAFNSQELGKNFTPKYFLDLGNGKYLVKKIRDEFYSYGILSFN